MENNTQELYHWGIKGQKWGQRRYQNKDGSLTPAGQKRYNKEVEKLKKETAKVKEAEKIAANRKKVQNKFDKLEAKKAALDERKKALKEGKDPEDEKKKTKATAEETVEQKRERLLNSSDPKELYENRSLLTTMELNDRIYRIETEARLDSKIVKEKQRTAKEFIEDATAMYKTIDNAYSTVANSAIVKTLAKQLGIDIPKDNSNSKKFNLMDEWNKVDDMSDSELEKLSKRIKNRKTVKDAVDAELNSRESENDSKNAKKEAKEAAKNAKKEAKEAAKNAKKEAKETAENAEKEAKEPAKNAEKEAEAAKNNKREAEVKKQAEKEAKEAEAKEAENRAAKLADAQRQVDEYIAKMYPEPSSSSSTTYRLSGSDIIDNRTSTRPNSPTVLLLEDKSTTRANEVPARVEDDGRSYAEKWQQIYGDVKVKSNG